MLPPCKQGMLADSEYVLAHNALQSIFDRPCARKSRCPGNMAKAPRKGCAVKSPVAFKHKATNGSICICLPVTKAPAAQKECKLDTPDNRGRGVLVHAAQPGVAFEGTPVQRESADRFLESLKEGLAAIKFLQICRRVPLKACMSRDIAALKGEPRTRLWTRSADLDIVQA